MIRHDVLIVGAGPAGATAAILLAQAGVRVRLADKARFPRDKLCGEFVSPEAARVLSRAGVLSSLSRSAGRARCARITDPVGHSVLLAIPSPAGAPADALGIPRKELDLALIEEAGRLGVEIADGFEVERAIFQAGRLAGAEGRERAGGALRALHAPVVLAADGRDSALARHLDPGSFDRRPSPRFALKAHFRDAGRLGGAVELHYFRGGYVGVHEVGGGTVNVCALIDRSLAGPLPSDPDRIFRQTLLANPAAHARLEAATRVSDWLAVGALRFRTEAPAREGVLFLGDAAGTIDPFAGEGMSMAFRSAEIAAEEILRWLGVSGPPTVEVDRSREGTADGAPARDGDGGVKARSLDPCPACGGPHEAYAVRWRSEFARRILLCRMLGQVAIRPPFQSVLIGALGRLPPLGRALARGTRHGVRAGTAAGI